MHEYNASQFGFMIAIPKYYHMSRVYFFRLSTKTVSGWPIVKDLTVFNGEHIIFAESSNIQIINRQVETAAGGYESPVTFSILTHRREITCLDFDPLPLYREHKNLNLI